MTTNKVRDRVCVVGTGMLGLLTIKNLTEQGLDVTAYERNTYIGGNWHVSTMKTDQTSALPGTTSNQSKYVVSVHQQCHDACYANCKQQERSERSLSVGNPQGRGKAVSRTVSQTLRRCQFRSEESTLFGLT